MSKDTIAQLVIVAAMGLLAWAGMEILSLERQINRERILMLRDEIDRGRKATGEELNELSRYLIENIKANADQNAQIDGINRQVITISKVVTDHILPHLNSGSAHGD